MAPSTVGLILLISRGHIRQCTTAAAAMQFVRRETITTTWFRTITADIHLVTHTGACEARSLRGQQAVMLAALAQVDRETTLSQASLEWLATHTCAGRLGAPCVPPLTMVGRQCRAP